MRAWMAELSGAFAEIFGDRAAFSVMVLAILIYGVLYPQPYLTEAVRDAPVVAVDQDNSAASRELLRRIDAFDTTSVVGTVPDMAAARRALHRREAFAIVVVPQFFERDLNAGRAAPIAAYGDASYFLLYSSTMNAITGAARSLGGEIAAGRLVATGESPARALAATQPLAITSVALFNPQGGYASYVVPASVVLILQQTLLMGTALLNTGRRHVRHSPRPVMTASARMAAYGVLFGVWMLAYLVLLPAILHLPRIGGLSDLAVIGVPFLLSTIFLGFTLARLLPVREWAMLAMVAIGIPLFFLSGVAWPVEMLPDWVRRLALMVPSTSAIPGIVRVSQMGASWQDVSQQVVTLWVLAGVYGVTAFAGLSSRTSAKARTASGTSVSGSSR